MLRSYRNHLLASGRAAGTVQLRVMHVRRLARTVSPLEATADQLTDLLAELASTHRPESRKSMRASLLSFYGWAHARGLIASNPAAHLEPITIPRTLPRVAADADIAAALRGERLEVRAMVMLARFGCLRLSEITRAHSRDRMNDTLRVLGKGSKERIIPLVPDLHRALEDLEKLYGGGHYFAGRYGGHLHPTTVGKTITRATGWNPHSLRHAGATAAYRSTRDLRAVQALLGHASLATTERYLHLDMDALRAAAAGTALLDTPARRLVA